MTTEALCVHWDRIAPPQGPISEARCKYCGRERTYQNHRWPDYNNEALNNPSTTALGRKLKRDWSEPLEWKEPVWDG